MKLNPFRVFFLILVSLFIFQPRAYTDKVIKVAILPFQINSPEKLDYLQRGILDMLASRISVEGKVVVLERSRVNEVLSQMPDIPRTEEAVTKIGIQLDADFIISGSLTKVAQSVSIDAKMFDLKEKKAVTSLFATSKGMDNVIPEINEFALKANARITGKPYPVYAAPPPPPTPSSEASAFMSEFLIPRKRGEGGISSDARSDFIMSRDPLRLRRGFWKSQRLDLEIKGVDVGDVNGDGKNETVVMDNNSISIYEYAADRLVLIKKIAGGRGNNYFSLDVADINKNGISEIFVTNLIGTQLDSFVIEFQKGDFKRIATGMKYFLKVIRPSQNGSMLVGQKIGMDGVFYGGVSQLVWKDSTYTEAEKIPLPSKAIVYGFNLIDLDRDGEHEIVLIDNDDQVRVFSNKGELVWKSEEIYGGTNNFMSTYPYGAKPTDATEHLETRWYIQNRILVQKNKGENEVIVSKNIPGAGKLFQRLRMYNESEIYSFVWDGLGLSENWRTRKIHGYIADFQISDIDNDGKDELVVGILDTSVTSTLKRAKSYVLAYDLVN